MKDYSEKLGATGTDVLSYKSSEFTGKPAYIGYLIAGLVTAGVGIGILVFASNYRQEQMYAPPAAEPPAQMEYSDSDFSSVMEAPEEGTDEASGPDFYIPIVYKLNDGQSNDLHIEVEVYDHELIFTHPEAATVRSGYTFLGWRYENLSSSAIDQPGEMVYFSEIYSNDPITYYACWQKDGPPENIPAENTPIGNAPVENVPVQQENIADDEGERVMIAANELRIRSGPGTSNREIGRLYSGDYVTIYRKETDNTGMKWGYIGQGWICIDNGYVTNMLPNTNGVITNPIADEFTANLVRDFVGSWQDRNSNGIHGTLHGKIGFSGEDFYITFQKYVSESERYEWHFVGRYDYDSNSIRYSNGEKWYIADCGKGGEISNVEYSDGTGELWFQDGKLLWDDFLEYAGGDSVFVKY